MRDLQLATGESQVDMTKADVVGKAGMPLIRAAAGTQRLRMPHACRAYPCALTHARASARHAGPTFTGFLAMLAWRGGYLSKQLSWSNMMLIPMYWFKAAVFGRDISRF